MPVPPTPPLPRRRATDARPGLFHPEDKAQLDDATSDLADHAALTAAHGATGAVVGTTNSQTLTNKTLTAPTIADFTNAAHDHLDADDGGTLSAAAIASGNLDNARLPASGTDANLWAWWYYAPGKKMYSQRFAATSGASPDLLVANEAAVPVGVTDFADLRIVGVEHDATVGGSAINSAVRQGATATTIDVTASTTDGSNLDTKVATFNVDVTLRDA